MSPLSLGAFKHLMGMWQIIILPRPKAWFFDLMVLFSPLTLSYPWTP